MRSILLFGAAVLGLLCAFDKSEKAAPAQSVPAPEAKVVRFQDWARSEIEKLDRQEAVAAQPVKATPREPETQPEPADESEIAEIEPLTEEEFEQLKRELAEWKKRAEQAEQIEPLIEEPPDESPPVEKTSALGDAIKQWLRDHPQPPDDPRTLDEMIEEWLDANPESTASGSCGNPDCRCGPDCPGPGCQCGATNAAAATGVDDGLYLLTQENCIPCVAAQRSAEESGVLVTRVDVAAEPYLTGFLWRISTDALATPAWVLVRDGWAVKAWIGPSNASGVRQMAAWKPARQATTNLAVPPTNPVVTGDIGWHSHRCACGTIWSHDGSGEHYAAHTCPSCGRYENEVYQGQPAMHTRGTYYTPAVRQRGFFGRVFNHGGCANGACGR